MLRLLLAAAALTVVGLPMAASGSPIQPQLNAKVTSRAISLTNTNGQRVRMLDQRSYRVVVKDSSKAQNFHLVGPGVNLKTRVFETSSRTWIVGLSPGTYVYKSDQNAKLRGTFSVTSSPPPA
jgi:hypothetical protein